MKSNSDGLIEGKKHDALTRWDYLASFPIPSHVLPKRLYELLKPVGMLPSQRVEVVCRYESEDQYGPNAESLHLLMAVVQGTDCGPIKDLNEAGSGVIEFSVLDNDSYGAATEFFPSISGHDYIVAAWGDNSFYAYNLAEKVWMSLGLTPRCIGGDQQRLIYDDLRLPEFGVAEGEVSSEYYWRLKNNVSWQMSNEYLRRYLWLRGARGVRVFFYRAQLDDLHEIRTLMGGKTHVVLKPEGEVSWYQLDIREHKGGLLLQLWASVEAVFPELCAEQTAEGILWPGDTEPMTHERADALIRSYPVNLDDRFLQKYEQNIFYDSTPFTLWGDSYCDPSYRGQWGFTDCRRVGRNLIEVPMRELYKPKPDREILHARKFAIEPEKVAHMDLSEEHIVAKVHRLVDVLLRLAEGLSSLSVTTGLNKPPSEFIKFDRSEILDEGWRSYPVLVRLAQVAPLDMSQQEFLDRCKRLHEAWQGISHGYLKSLLQAAGCPRVAVKNLGSLKLLEALLNILEVLNVNKEAVDAFVSEQVKEGWNQQNKAMAPLFLNYDLRNADAHENMGGCLATLQELDFDTANINEGYGRALDFVMDGVINALDHVSVELEQLVIRT